MNEKAHRRLQKIVEKIDYVSDMCDAYPLDEILADAGQKRPAVMMFLQKIAEQFIKLRDDGAYEILSHFPHEDIKGMIDVRNYIAHDYEVVSDEVIRYIVENKLTRFRHICTDLMEKN